MRREKTEVIELDGKLYYIRPYRHEDLECAIDSGREGDRAQYLYMDYDAHYPRDCRRIMRKYGLRRMLVLETSPHRWSAVSFTPMPIRKIFEIFWNSRRIDRSFAASFLRFRRSAIRITRRASIKGYPKIRRTLINEDGKQFYDYDSERHFRELLKSEVIE